MRRKIVLLAGQPCSGKTEVANHLEKTHDFAVVAISRIIKDFADHRNIELTQRADYQATHLRIVKELGQHAIVDTILGTPSNRICVDGMRVPAYANALRQQGAWILALRCPFEIRYQRSLERGRPLDKKSLEDFRRDERSENFSRNPFDQYTDNIILAADYYIDSSLDLSLVKERVDTLIASGPPRRPPGPLGSYLLQ